MEQNQDKEIEAITDIVESLKDLDDGGRLRVVKYVLERLGIVIGINETLPPRSTQQSFGPGDFAVPLQSVNGLTDIKMLRGAKNPKTAIQMAVLVAYYLQEVAPINDRKDTVDTNDIEKYFKQAGFKLPAGKNGAANTLNNAKNSGYLEAATRGAFKLNPVGYNLVVHGLPESTLGHGKKKSSRKIAPKTKKRQ